MSQEATICKRQIEPKDSSLLKVKEIRLLNDKLLNSRKVVKMKVKKKLKTQLLIKKLKWHQFMLRFKILSS